MNITTFLSGVVVLFWLLFVASLAIIVVRASRNQPVRNAALFSINHFGAGVVITALNAGLVFIKPDERGRGDLSRGPQRLPRNSSHPRLTLDHPLRRECGYLHNLHADVHHVDCHQRRRGPGR